MRMRTKRGSGDASTAPPSPKLASLYNYSYAALHVRAYSLNLMESQRFKVCSSYTVFFSAELYACDYQ